MNYVNEYATTRNNKMGGLAAKVLVNVIRAYGNACFYQRFTVRSDGPQVIFSIGGKQYKASIWVNEAKYAELRRKSVDFDAATLARFAAESALEERLSDPVECAHRCIQSDFKSLLIHALLRKGDPNLRVRSEPNHEPFFTDPYLMVHGDIEDLCLTLFRDD